MLQLSPTDRRSLRARAHALNPVVSIAQGGLSDGVMKEIDASLKAHELIKIRVYNDNRDDREAFLATICQELGAAPVQHIGKLLVVWRPAADDENSDRQANKNKPRRSTRTATRRTKRSFQS